MKFRECDKCKTQIEIKDRYQEGTEEDVDFGAPCDTCEHCWNLEDEYPCEFCTHMYDGQVHPEDDLC